MAHRSRARKKRPNSRTLTSIDDLRPAPYNPRTISESTTAGLGISLEEFGDLSGITWNIKTGHLVTGHQRLEQLKKRDARMVDGVVVTSDGGRFPVRVVDWPVSKEKSANVVANNPAICGEFTPTLDGLLDEIKTGLGPEMFGELALDELIGKGGELASVVEDDAPEPPKKPITKLGDLWLLVDHRLLCSDSSDENCASQLMGDEHAEMMNTDAPYGVDYAAVKNGIPRNGFKDIQARVGDIENDDLTTGPELQAFLEKVIKAFVPHMNQRPAFYFWHPMLTQGTFFAAAAAAILIHRQIIWVKPHMVLTRSGQYHWQHELCFYGWIRGKQCPWYGDKSQTSVWLMGESQRLRQHPTQKPVELFARPMPNHTRKGGLVCEPFAGSGSQFVAAEQLERRCFGMEIAPKYCDVVVERWGNLTSGKARRKKGTVNA